MRAIELKIDDIYVPAGRRKELDTERLDEVADNILEDGAEQPIQVREDKNRYVLVKGVHRLEARKALGDETIQAFVVSARRF